MKALLVSKFSNLPVARKIWGLAGFLMLANLMVVGTILLQLNSIKSEIGEISSEHMPLTEITTSLTVHQLEQAIQFERGLRVAEHLNSNPSAAEELAQIEKHFSELGHKIGKEVKQAEALAESVIQHTQVQAVRVEYEKILSGFKHYEKAHVTFETHVHEVFDGAKAGALDIHQIEQLAHKIEKEEDALDQEIEGLLAEIERFTAKSLETVDDHEQNAFLLGLILTVVSIALSLPVGFLIIRGIVRPLDNVVDALDVLATGDTSRDVEISSDDEIGKTARAYEILRQKTIETRDLTAQQEAEMKRQRKELIEKLSGEFDASVKDVLGGVSTSVTNLEQSANAMASTVEETSHKSTVVASATEETVANAQTVASATEEMDNSIREISSQVQQSASIAKQAVEEASHTNDSVQSLEGAAQEIGEVVKLTSRNCRADKSPGPECHNRSSPGRRSGQGFCCRRVRGQGTGKPDSKSNRHDFASD